MHLCCIFKIQQEGNFKNELGLHKSKGQSVRSVQFQSAVITVAAKHLNDFPSVCFSIRKRKGDEVDGNVTSKKKQKKEKDRESKQEKLLKVCCLSYPKLLKLSFQNLVLLKGAGLTAMARRVLFIHSYRIQSLIDSHKYSVNCSNASIPDAALLVCFICKVVRRQFTMQARSDLGPSEKLRHLCCGTFFAPDKRAHHFKQVTKKVLDGSALSPRCWWLDLNG